MVLLTHLKAGFEKGDTVVARLANDGGLKAVVPNFGATAKTSNGANSFIGKYCG